jgi:hypothetical protein
MRKPSDSIGAASNSGSGAESTKMTELLLWNIEKKKTKDVKNKRFLKIIIYSVN